jgi:predicted LPLAT superfamily acyltransferase
LTILTGDLSPFEISFQGLEHLESAHQSRKGAVLVGSHFGSFDVLRTFSHGLRQYPVRAIMYGQSTPTLLSILGAINPKLHEEIRVVPGPAALISLVPELNKGAMIGLLGDRILPGERHAWFDFLGSPAPFPLTPALVADVLEVPLIQFICRHKGFGRYEVQFYVLGDGPSGPRCERTERIRRHTLAYVQHLEHHVRAAPHNWFNFHDFWSSPQ